MGRGWKTPMNPRWKTFELGIEIEEESRKKTLEAIDLWWTEFATRNHDLKARIQGKAEWNLVGWMEDFLQGINPNLMWEFGPGLQSGHRLVITPENRYDLRPLVDELLSRAPTLEGWSFFGHRLPESYDQAISMVIARTSNELAATGFKCLVDKFNRINVSVEFSRSFLRDYPDLAFSQTFILLETLLGEKVLNAWIGEIKTAKKSWRSRSLKTLPKAMKEAQEAIRKSLPNLSSKESADGCVWSLFELEPEPKGPYPDQSDLFVGKAINLEQWKNGHSEVPFFSERFSNEYEIHCFLKIDHTEESTKIDFEEKCEIEDALDERLRKAALGCIVGGGTGLRYFYIDLAIFDLQ